MFFPNVISKYFDSSSNVLLLGIFIILLSFFSALIAYYTYVSYVLYFSFILLVTSISIFFVALTFDIYKNLKSFYLAAILSTLLFIVYFYLHLHLHHFDFFLADASDYYLSGLNSVINHRDMGFFLPLTAALSAVGFEILGYDYAPFVMVLLYTSTIPLSYFIMQFFLKNSLISIIVSLLIIISPLAIWFPKSTYSESLWQVQLLILIVLSYHISTQIKPHILSIFALVLSMLLLPFTRGEATLLYAVIVFLSIFHIWKFHTLKYPIFIVMSLLFLDIGVHFTLQSRAHYLLTWQYNRIIPNVTEVQLMTILYSFAFGILLLLFIIFFFKHIFRKLNLFILITILALISKVIIAYIYMHKSNPLFHNFDFMNEYGFALENFGLPLTLLIIIGLILLHYKAIKGNIMALILVIFYAIFYLPFAMQAVQFEDIHEIFLYWNRYYFSLIMIIHLYALGITLQYIYSLLIRTIKNPIYTKSTFILVVSLLAIFSLKFKLISITSEEAYLENSQKLMPWVSKHINTEPLSIIYDESIKYNLHHNRSYDAKILTYRTFPVAKINVKMYQKVNTNLITSSYVLNDKIKKNSYVLCLATKPCKLNPNDIIYIDTITLPIRWREHYGIHPKKDMLVHKGEVTQSIKHSLNLHATLYRIKEKFQFNKKIIFKKSSLLSDVILKDNWYYTTVDTGAWSKHLNTKLFIPYLSKKAALPYQIQLEYFIFDASKQSPKTISIIINNHTIKKVTAVTSKMETLSFTVPLSYLPSTRSLLETHIQIKDTQPCTRTSPYRIYVKSMIITRVTK